MAAPAPRRRLIALADILMDGDDEEPLLAGLGANLGLVQVLNDGAMDIEPPPRPEIGGQRITTDWLRSLPTRECLYRFRFYAEELTDLARALRIPDPFKTANGSSFTRVEALCLLLARFKSAGDMYELSTQYDRSQAALSEVINELTIYLDDRWDHLLDFDTAGVLSPERMQDYADAIHDVGAPLDSVWGFIDCTIRPICHPSQYQRAVYSGHKKVHALKFQAVKLPNGLIGHLFGPMGGRRNDNALLAESQLLDRCYQYAIKPGTNEDTPREERHFHLFGDPAYGISPVLLSPFSHAGERTAEEDDWNAEMAAVRIEVEHGFGDVVRHWPFLNAWWKHRLYASPVGRYYRLGVLLTNALNCLRPNQTAQYFNCEPPVLEDYFHD